MSLRDELIKAHKKKVTTAMQKYQREDKTNKTKRKQQRRVR